MAEAERLRVFVVHEEGKDYPSIRAVLYEEFTALIARIDLMVSGDKQMNLEDLL